MTGAETFLLIAGGVLVLVGAVAIVVLLILLITDAI